MATGGKDPERQLYPVFRYVHFDPASYVYGDFRLAMFVANDLLESVETNVCASPSVLALRCGDIRSCFYSLWKNFVPGRARFGGIRFVLNDNSAAVLARNVLLLYLTLKMPERKDSAGVALKEWLAAVWAIWFCCELQPKHACVLKEALGDLIGWSSNLERWTCEENPLGKMVAFASYSTLTEICSKWKNWYGGKQSVEVMRKFRSELLALLTERIDRSSTNFVRSVHGVEQADLISSNTCLKYQMMKKEMQEFLVSGTPFVERILELPNEVVEMSVNGTFFEHAESGRHTMNPLDVPFESFLQNFQYSKKEVSKIGVSDSSTLNCLIVEDQHFEHSPFLANSLQQLMLWLSGAADVIARLGPNVSFVLDCSVGVEFCQQMCSDAGVVQEFDVIHCSDLMDHTSPPSLVLSAVPLLKRNAFLFTTILLYRGCGTNVNNFLHTVFGFEPELLPVMCGVRCVGCDGEFSDPVLLQPKAFDSGNVILQVNEVCPRQLVWQKVSCLPLLLPPPDSTSAYAKALLDAALVRPRFKPSPGNAILRHLSTETTVFIIRSFVSQLCLDPSVQFWEGIASLILKEASLQCYLLHLQTQAHLHGIHIHLDKDHCSLCSPMSVISQFSVLVKEKCLRSESVFDIIIHKEEVFNESKEHHIVDSASGRAVGQDLMLDFFFPQRFAENGFYMSIWQQQVTRSHHAPSDSVEILSGKLSDFIVPHSTYSFQLATSVPLPSTRFTVKEHCGDAKTFRTTLSLGSIPSSELKVGKVKSNQISPSKLQILFGKLKETIHYPYPIDKGKLTFSSSQKTLEITVSRKKHLFYEEELLPFKATLEHKLTFPPFQMNLALYHTMFSLQFTQEEDKLLKSAGCNSSILTSEIHLKQLMCLLFKHDDIKFLILSSNEGIIVGLIVIHNHVLDLQNKLPVVDLSFYLSSSTISTVVKHWDRMVDSTVKQWDLYFPLDACALICSVLKYFARRTIQSSESNSSHLLSKYKLDQYFTHAAVHLLHRDPDAIVEDLFKLKGVSLQTLGSKEDMSFHQEIQNPK